MRNKKAWLRIVEAVISILIILVAIFFIVVEQTPSPDIESIIYERQTDILNIISENDSLRADILVENNTNVNNAILQRIPSSWNFSTNICNLSEVCSAEVPYDKEVYVSERLITSNLTDYQPKKLKFFVWMK